MIEIDREKVYMSDGYAFHNFVTLFPAELEMVLEWRNCESVRRWMYDSAPIEHQDHLRFVERLRSDNSRYYWLVSQNGSPIGCMNLVDIYRERNEAEVGWYLNPELDGSGSGFYFILNIMTFAFDVIGIEQINGGVNRLNHSALLLDDFFGAEFNTSADSEGDFISCRLRRDVFTAIRAKQGSITQFVRFMKANKNKL